MERGLIPPNIHFKEPIPELKPFIDNKEIKIITEPTPWNGTYAALNCFGFGGVNVNTILKRPALTQKTEEVKNNTVPQILLSCGRTEESVQSMFENSILKDAHREFFALFHKLAYSSPKKKPYRGYKILGTEKNIHEIKVSNHNNRYYFTLLKL